MELEERAHHHEDSHTKSIYNISVVCHIILVLYFCLVYVWTEDFIKNKRLLCYFMKFALWSVWMRVFIAILFHLILSHKLEVEGVSMRYFLLSPYDMFEG